MQIEQAIDTTGIELEDHQMDASVRNPAELIQTYHVTIRKGDDVETCRTHHYSMEDCIAWLLYQLKDGWEIVYVTQPDSQTTINAKQIKEQYHG